MARADGKPDRRTIQVDTDLHLDMKADAGRRDMPIGKLVRVAYQALLDQEAAEARQANASGSRHGRPSKRASALSA